VLGNVIAATGGIGSLAVYVLADVLIWGSKYGCGHVADFDDLAGYGFQLIYPFAFYPLLSLCVLTVATFGLSVASVARTPK
jgi:hypothetical protein